jgi:hypothetical protein
MRRLLAAALAAGVLLVGCGGGDEPKSVAQATSEATTSPEPEEGLTAEEDANYDRCAEDVPASADSFTEEFQKCLTDPDYEAPVVDPEPEGRYGLASCDVDIEWEGMSRLLGSTQLKNTGEVTTESLVTFKWLLGDGSKINATNRKVVVRPGKEKYVFFKVDAPGNTVSLFQDHPAYFDGSPCKTKVTIIRAVD